MPTNYNRLDSERRGGGGGDDEARPGRAGPDRGRVPPVQPVVIGRVLISKITDDYLSPVDGRSVVPPPP